MATAPKPNEPLGAQPEAGRATKRPIAIVDFGKAQSRQKIKRLRKGDGKLVSRIESIVGEFLESPSISKGDPPVIVIIVREKGSTSLGSMMPMMRSMMPMM
jgi:hypothetical protein